MATSTQTAPALGAQTRRTNGQFGHGIRTEVALDAPLTDFRSSAATACLLCNHCRSVRDQGSNPIHYEERCSGDAGGSCAQHQSNCGCAACLRSLGSSGLTD